MLSTIFSLGLATLAIASPTKRAGGLSVSLGGPAAVNGLDSLKITVAVTNNGAKDIKLLKYGTVLDDILPSMSFVVSKGGVEAKFTGVKAQVQPELAEESSYAVIPAGKTLKVEHDLSQRYDFAALGAGKFKFEPLSTFHVASEASLAKVDIGKDNSAIEIELKGDLASRELKMLAGRASISCSTSSYSSFISSAYSEGKSLASLAASYISTYGASGSLYVAYFGASSTTTVRSKFTAVANESGSRTLNCNDPYGYCTSGVIAYTLTSTTNIYFCSPFYSEVTTSRLCSGTTVASRNIRGGTVLHEITHAVASTTDVTYGCAADQALSDANSVRNADNYNCFATQVYASTQC